MTRDSRHTKQLPDDLAELLPSITLTFTIEHPLVPHDGLQAIQTWDVVATVFDLDAVDDSEQSVPSECVGTMRLIKGNLEYTHLWEQLDAIDGDLDTVASQVLARNFFTESELGDTDPEDDLSADVLDVIDGVTGSSLLILNSVTLADRWRGHGIGRMLAGEALLALGGDARCMAAIPAPLDESEGEERQRGIRKLQHVWAQLGFKPLPRGVWVLDPATTELTDTVADLREQFGVMY